jgi:hypothetical protein
MFDTILRFIREAKSNTHPRAKMSAASATTYIQPFSALIPPAKQLCDEQQVYIDTCRRTLPTSCEHDPQGYATSLQDGLFENDLDAKVDDAEPGSISDLHSTPATLASPHAILQGQGPYDSDSEEVDGIDIPEDEEDSPHGHSRLPHITYKTKQHLAPMNSFTDPDYFTAAFPTLFPFGIGGHLGDANGDRTEEMSL